MVVMPLLMLLKRTVTLTPSFITVVAAWYAIGSHDHESFRYLGNSEDEEMSAIMEEMDKELADSEMGKSFEREKVRVCEKVCVCV